MSRTFKDERNRIRRATEARLRAAASAEPAISDGDGLDGVTGLRGGGCGCCDGNGARDARAPGGRAVVHVSREMGRAAAEQCAAALESRGRVCEVVEVRPPRIVAAEWIDRSGRTRSTDVAGWEALYAAMSFGEVAQWRRLYDDGAYRVHVRIAPRGCGCTPGVDPVELEREIARQIPLGHAAAFGGHWRREDGLWPGSRVERKRTRAVLLRAAKHGVDCECEDM
jgi:hypothetical protein